MLDKKFQTFSQLVLYIRHSWRPYILNYQHPNESASFPFNIILDKSVGSRKSAQALDAPRKF